MSFTYTIPSQIYGAQLSNRFPYKAAGSACQYFIDLRNEISYPNSLGNVVVSNVTADYPNAGSLTISSLGSNGTVAGFLISNGTDAVNYRINLVAPIITPSNSVVETYFITVELPVGYSTSAYDKLILQGDINGIGLGVIQTSLSASAAANIANAIGNSITNVAYANAAGYANVALYYPVTSVNGQTGNVVVQAGNTIVTLIGDVTGNGLTNSNISTTLANTGVVAGTYGSATQVAEHVVDSKGRIISAANVAISYPVTSVNGQTGNVVVQAGNTIVTLIGDVTANGLTGSNISTTLANTGVVAGTYGSATQVATHVVNSKGLITSASNVAISYPTSINYANLAGTANVALSGWTYPVTSVNGMTGNVVITNVTSVAFANVAGYANFAGSANTATTANVALSGWTYPVTSVNGQTGAVVISNVSNATFANVANYANFSGSATTANTANIALYYPVTSVNGQTGNVVVQAGNTVVTLIGDVTANGLTGSNITTTLANTGVVPGTYGSATQVATQVVNSKGLITSISNVAISYPTSINYANLAGTANVALSGWTYPVTSVNGMTGNVLVSNVAVANYANFAGSANTATTANVALSGWTYPVTSVNGQTGAVVISNVAVASFANASAVANTVNTITSSQITTALGYTPLSNTSNIVITGDVVGSGNSTNIVATLATIGSLGTYSLASITIDAKGRVIAASNGTAGAGGTYVPVTGGTFTGQVVFTGQAVFNNTATAVTQPTLDNTSNIATTAFVQNVVQYLPLSFAFSGKPLSGQMIHLAITPVVPITIPANFANSVAVAFTSPTTNAVVNVYVVNSTNSVSSIGNITYYANGVTTLSGSSYQSNVGDVIRVTAPSPQDPTLSDLAITLIAKRIP